MTVIVDHSELGGLDAVESARRIRAGDLKASEVVASAIERARALNPHLNAIPTANYEAALARAEQPAPGPFSGVPTFVKALDDVAGSVNDQGSRAFPDRVGRRTEPYVARMLDTGLVSLGRSAAPEIGLSGTTEPLAHGPTRNPWNVDHSTGGSSGGAAALVASRVVPIAHSSDAGGSIRIPASSCGLVGLKASRGRGFTSKLAELLPVKLFVYGAVSRSVRDTAHFTAALEAKTPKHALPPIGLVEGPASERLRVGLISEAPGGQDIDPEVREATLEAGRVCAGLGHRVDEIANPYAASVLDDLWIYIGYLAFATKFFARATQPWRFDAAKFEPWTNGLVSLFTSNWRDSLRIVRRMRATARVSAERFRDYDVLLSPTLASPPPAIGEFAPDRPFEVVRPLQQHHLAFTPIQNITGEPAISLPMGMSRAGLPIGVQFASALGEDAKLLALAYELEAAGSFHILA